MWITKNTFKLIPLHTVSQCQHKEKESQIGCQPLVIRRLLITLASKFPILPPSLINLINTEAWFKESLKRYLIIHSFYSADELTFTNNGVHSASCPMGTGVHYPWLKSGRRVTLTTHPHLFPRSRMSRSHTSSLSSASMECSGTVLALFIIHVLCDYSLQSSNLQIHGM
jgi:hypothetical protein